MLFRFDQHLERIDARVVPITPDHAHRVVADWRDVLDGDRGIVRPRRPRRRTASVPLATGARTEPAQKRRRILAHDVVAATAAPLEIGDVAEMKL